MRTLIDKQFEFNLWANTEIIKLCSSLDETQLSVEIPGVYGRIHPTIAHIIQAEGTYLCDLGGDPLGSNEIYWESLTLSQLLDMAQQSGVALREKASHIGPETRCEFTEDNKRHMFPAWTVINQAINHGIEHRTQLRLLLTKLGVPHPGQSVWGFAEWIGELQIHDVAKE